MVHKFTTSDWEPLDSIWGINAPARHIWVQVNGFQIRKRTAGVGVGGAQTPACIEYGGVAAIAVTTVEAIGKPEQTMSFLQGVGDCSK